MRVFVECSTEAMTAQLRQMVEEVGHVLAGQPHNALVLLIDDGYADLLHRIARLRALQPAIEPVVVVHADEPKMVPSLAKDFIMGPPRPEELRARLDRIAMRRTSAGTRYEDLLAMAVEATGDVIEITDPDSTLQYVNPAFEQVLGYGAEEAIGKTPAQLFRSGMHSPEYFEDIERTIADGEVWKGLLISQRPDERLVYLDSVIAPVYDFNGQQTHRIAVKRDITNFKLVEAELRRLSESAAQARDAAIEASRIKSQFVANMSHELRTPLNAILGYAEMLEEEIDDLSPDEVVEDVARIRKAGLHLLSLVNDVLDMSKIEAGHTEMHLEELELEPLLAAVAQTMDPLVNDRRNDLVIAYEYPAPTIRTDLVKLRQCVLNLVSNANKFTEQGTITVRARAAEAPEGRDGDWISIEIIDTGIGMNEEQQRRLFQPFMQADASTTRRFGGTGLGLHITQRFCEMLGGRVSVTSEEGKGSVFSMLLPAWLTGAQPARLEGEHEELQPRMHPKVRRRGRTRGDIRPKVLLVDDDRDQHDLIARELEALGYDLVAFEHGAQALAHLKVEQPDLVLLDVRLPGMDGWAILAQVREDPALEELPVVMISANDASERARAAGAESFLMKPVTRRALALTLQRWCPARSARVLLIDADDESRIALTQAVEKAGHVVFSVESVAAAQESVEREPPHLVFVDMATEGLDVQELVRFLRARPELAKVPVMVVHSDQLPRDDRTRLEHASAMVLSRKAYSEAELVERVGTELERAAERSSV